MTRNLFRPKIGQWYENLGGGKYKCIHLFNYHYNNAVMQSPRGWTFVAHNIGIYDNGKIDWDYSTGGRFEQVPDSVQ